MIAHATGDYLMFLDSDDILLPGAVETLVDNIIRYDADIVIGNYSHVTIDGEIIKKSNYKNGIYTGNREILAACFNRRPNYNFHFACWAKIFKTSFLREKQVRFIDEVILDDWVFSLLAFTKASKIVTISNFVYQYTAFRPNSLVNDKQKELTPKGQRSWVTLQKFYAQQLILALKSNNNCLLPFLIARLLLISTKTSSRQEELSITNFIKLVIKIPKTKINISYLLQLIWQRRKQFFLLMNR